MIMRFMHKIILLLLVLIVSGDHLLAEETVYPESKMVMIAYFDSDTKCNNNWSPRLSSIRVVNGNDTISLEESQYVEANISLGDSVDSDGFIYKNGEKIRCNINATISHFGRNKNDKEAKIDEAVELKVGSNLFPFGATCDCGIGINDEWYRLKLYIYVDCPPSLENIITKSNLNGVYSYENPLNIKLNGFYANENTTCELQYSLTGMSYRNLHTTQNGYSRPVP